MNSRKLLLVSFVLLGFIFCSSPAFAEQEGKTKIGEKLIALKNLVIQERLKNQKLNEELQEQNSRLLEDNERLKTTIAGLQIEKDYLSEHLKGSSKRAKVQPEEKIVYRDSPSQQEEIQRLEQQISELSQSLEEKDRQITKGKADIQDLNKVIEEVYDNLLIISENK